MSTRFSRGGRGHDESLHTGGLPLPAVLAPHYVGEGGTQYGKRSQEQYITLFGILPKEMILSSSPGHT